jgi:outer membrane immunogenic protein
LDTTKTTQQGQASVAAFRQKVRELGWTEGGNVLIDTRWAGSDPDKARAFAKELVGMRPDVIVTSSNLVTEIVQRETRTVPIVFVFVGDPVGSGFVTNVARPDGNLTGFPVCQSDTLEPSGFIGGGQIGYNWQLSPIWVVGLEADFQGSLEKDSVTSTKPFDVFFAKSLPPVAPLVPAAATATGTSVLNYTTKIDWFGTVRARLGYVWGDGAVLTYVTGGLAYGKVELDATSTVSGIVSGGIGNAPVTVPFSISHAINHSQVNTGWTVGFGTEGKLLIPGWTYKIESLYMDLGSDPSPDICLNCSSAVNGGLITGHAHFTDAILRAGLNYQFH